MSMTSSLIVFALYVSGLEILRLRQSVRQDKDADLIERGIAFMYGVCNAVSVVGLIHRRRKTPLDASGQKTEALFGSLLGFSVGNGG